MSIIIVDGFDLRQRGPLDKRTIFKTKEMALAFVSERQRYEGLQIYILDEKVSYQFQGGVKDSDFVKVKCDNGLFSKMEFDEEDFKDGILNIPIQKTYENIFLKTIRKKETLDYVDVYVDVHYKDSGIQVESNVPFKGMLILEQQNSSSI